MTETTVTYNGEPRKGAGAPKYIEPLGGYLYPGTPVTFSDSFARAHGWRGTGREFADYLFSAQGGYYQAHNSEGKPLFTIEYGTDPDPVADTAKAASGKSKGAK